MLMMKDRQDVYKRQGYKTSAQATGASVENINLILNNEAEIAIAMQGAVMQAYEGFGAYDTPSEDLRAMMRLWPNYVPVSYTHLDVYKRQR